jgi:hypothetical protein
MISTTKTIHVPQPMGWLSYVLIVVQLEDLINFSQTLMPELIQAYIRPTHHHLIHSIFKLLSYEHSYQHIKHLIMVMHFHDSLGSILITFYVPLQPTLDHSNLQLIKILIMPMVVFLNDFYISSKYIYHILKIMYAI